MRGLNFIILTLFAGACFVPSNYILAANKDAEVFYNPDISAIFAQNGCASPKCHGSDSGAGGLKFAMFNGAVDSDYAQLVSAYKSRYLDTSNAENSVLFRKLSGGLAHTGATLSIDELETLKSWINQGAKFNNPSPSAQIVSLQAKDKEIVIKKGEKIALKIDAVFADKSKRDTSASCLFEVEGDAVKVSRQGEVEWLKSGIAFIKVSNNRKFCIVKAIAQTQNPPKITPEKPANEIDTYIAKIQEKAGVAPSEICSDSEFMRRLYLDATGLLPKPQKVESFLKDKSKTKRAKLIDEVLESPEFSDMLAMRISDILRLKSEFPSNLWPNAAQAYYTWLRDSIANQMPYNVMARSMLLSSGSNFKIPPANFYRAVSVKNAENYAEAAALVFMGVRTNCIKCHAHPSESWTPEDNLKLSKFFNHLNLKKSKEWKEEILTLDLSKTETANKVQTNYIFGEKIECPSGVDTREAFADWLLKPENPYFSKAIVNRIWFWIFSVGLQNPADDIRPNKGAISDDVLKFLEAKLKDSGFNLKEVYKTIFLSNTYQRSHKTNSSNAEDEVTFSHHIPTRLEAEYLNDIISTSLGVYQPFKSITPEPYAFWPEDFKAICLHDGSVSNPFLTLFGKPGRNSSYLNDRSNAVSMQQILHLAGSANINQKLDRSDFLKKLAPSAISNRDKVKTLYLTFLTRQPTQREYEICLKYFDSGKSPLEALKDITWAILNSREFIFKL